MFISWNQIIQGRIESADSDFAFCPPRLRLGPQNDQLTADCFEQGPVEFHQEMTGTYIAGAAPTGVGGPKIYLWFKEPKDTYATSPSSQKAHSSPDKIGGLLRSG